MFERLKSVAFSITGGTASVEGLWERVGDNFAGCIIIAEPAVKGLLQGRITNVPAKMRQYGWKVGDIKWKRLEPRKSQSVMMDLFKEVDPKTKELIRATYEESKLYFISEHEFIIEARGRKTRWQRMAKTSK